MSAAATNDPLTGPATTLGGGILDDFTDVSGWTPVASGQAQLLAFEREADHSLVVGAGIPAEWLEADGGVGVDGLPTWYGTSRNRRPASW